MVSQALGKMRDALLRLSRFIRRRESSDAFVAYVTGSVPSGGGTETLHIQNPTQGRIIDIEQFVIVSQFRGQYAIYDRFDGDVTGGSSVTIGNLRLDSAGGPPDSGDMSAASGVSFTDTGTHFSAAIPSGDSPGGTSGGAGAGTEPLIEPGREIVIELQNDSTSTRVGTVGVVYTERPTADD
jgi:hypothetical protein